MWPALFLISNQPHIRQLQFATHAFSQTVSQQAVQISICQWQLLAKNMAATHVHAICTRGLHTQ